MTADFKSSKKLASHEVAITKINEETEYVVYAERFVSLLCNLRALVVIEIKLMLIKFISYINRYT